MKCGISPDDYSAQKTLVDQVQSVAHNNPVHIHLVAHARKGHSDESPARLHDIKGRLKSQTWRKTSFPFGVTSRKRRFRDGSKDIEPDAMFIVEAQRNCGGEIGKILWFKRDAMIYFEPQRLERLRFHWTDGGGDMNITKGPMLEEYAKNRDIPIAEVLEWANQIVNQPASLHGRTAKTEKDANTMPGFALHT